MAPWVAFLWPALIAASVATTYPVSFVMDVRFHEVVIVHLKQESAALRDVVYLRLSPSFYLCFPLLYSVLSCSVARFAYHGV